MSAQAWRSMASESTPADVSCDLDTTPAREVRRLARELLADRNGVMVDDAVLVATELISNAHRHAAAPRTCRLILTNQRRRLRIEVDDASSDLPRMRTPDRTGGRGLVLVSQLASCWGVQSGSDHKTVWAELALDGAATSGHARHLAAAPDGRRSP